MGMAVFALSAFARPLFLLHRWLSCQRARRLPGRLPLRSALSQNAASPCEAAPAADTEATVGALRIVHGAPVPALRRPCAVHAPARRPLRVVHGGGMPGRLVISGRMADVCAELERLAAQEQLRAAPQIRVA